MESYSVIWEIFCRGLSLGNTKIPNTVIVIFCQQYSLQELFCARLDLGCFSLRFERGIIDRSSEHAPKA